MMNKKDYIPEGIIKQVFLLVLIVVLLGIISFNLALFIPALLGAITLYVVTRDLNLYLQEKLNWKPALAALAIIFLCLVVLILPLYFLGDLLVSKLSQTQAYIPKIEKFLTNVQQYIMELTDINISSTENIKSLTNFATGLSTTILSSTLNAFSIVTSMFFILYFMLEKPRQLESVCNAAVPFKRANSKLVGQKFRKLVMANAVGIPVVALGQGLVALVGYLIFGAPSPVLFFALTAITSMIPIVGGAIVFVPVSVFMMMEGDMFGGVGLLVYCMVVVGLTDNILRFTLLKKLEDIHPLNTVFGIIMGMNLFGFMGLVFGPILVSMTVLLMQIYRDEFSDSDTPDLHVPEEELKNKIDLTI
ncbi:AI-2E family transporter [Bergeyella zoohelcum]|nr:AI-2E family transporter [Bergeyella zoohelcum]